MTLEDAGNKPDIIDADFTVVDTVVPDTTPSIDTPPESTVEGMRTTSPEDVSVSREGLSYREIGEQNLSKATESVRSLGRSIGGTVSKGWSRIKSWGSRTASAGKTAVVYAAAMPQMITDASNTVQQKYVEGVDAVKDGVSEAITSAADWVGETKEGIKEAGSSVINRAIEEAVYVSDSVKEGYQSAIDYRNEKFNGLLERAADARAILQAAVEAGRERKKARMERAQNAEYMSLKAQLEELREKLSAMEAGLASTTS